MKAEIYRSGAGSLDGRAVFLSASKPTRDLNLFPLASEVEIDECVRCLARAVFAERGHLVFGAHPTISPLIVDVATEYFPPSRGKMPLVRPVTIYQSKAFKDVIPAATRQLEQLGFAEIIFTDRIAGEEFNPALPPGEQCLQSLAHMRARMFADANPVAMVTAGGMQGILREARLFLQTQVGNIYSSNALGGAAANLLPYLADNLLNENFPYLMQGWEQRIIEIETENSAWDLIRKSKPNLPTHPYALLMQHLVQRIAGEIP